MMRSVQMPAIEPMDPEVIKAFAQGFNARKALLGGWPILRFPSSATSNVIVLMAEEDSLDRGKCLVLRRGRSHMGLAEQAVTRRGRTKAVLRRYGTDFLD